MAYSRRCHQSWVAGDRHVQAALRGETPVSQQTSQAGEGVRMVAIDDTPDEDGT